MNWKNTICDEDEIYVEYSRSIRDIGDNKISISSTKQIAPVS